MTPCFKLLPVYPVLNQKYQTSYAYYVAIDEVMCPFKAKRPFSRLHTQQVAEVGHEGL